MVVSTFSPHGSDRTYELLCFQTLPTRQLSCFLLQSFTYKTNTIEDLMSNFKSPILSDYLSFVSKQRWISQFNSLSVQTSFLAFVLYRSCFWCKIMHVRAHNKQNVLFFLKNPCIIDLCQHRRRKNKFFAPF